MSTDGYPAGRIHRWRKIAAAGRLPDPVIARWLLAAPADVATVEDLPPVPDDLERQARDPANYWPILVRDGEDPRRAALAHLDDREAWDRDAHARTGLSVVELLTHEAAAPGGAVSWETAAAAAAVLADQQSEGCALADTSEARERLPGAVARHLRAFARSVIGEGRLLGPVTPRPAGEAPRKVWTAHLETAPRAAELAAAPREVDGFTVAALSAELARYLEGLGEAGAKVARAWLAGEAQRFQDATAPMLADDWPRPSPLAGWHRDDLIGQTSVCDPPGTSKAVVVLSVAVWLAEVRPELAPAPYPVSMLLLPLAAAAVAAPRSLDLTGAWQQPATLEVEVIRLLTGNALATVDAAALVRFLPELARLAANRAGHPLTIRAGDGLVFATLTNAKRTEVEIRGGYAALAALLQRDNGRSRTQIADAARALAALPIEWSAHDHDGVSALILDLTHDHAANVLRFALPRMLWPGFSTELRDRPATRIARRRVPVDPTLPPGPGKLGDRPHRLELAAMAWLRDRLDGLTATGGIVPWEQLADEVSLSDARQRTRRLKVLNDLLTLWTERGRWHNAGERWRPEYGWEGPGSLLEAKEQTTAGRVRRSKASR